ncbi:MAG TPA: hypothetical protein VGI81_21445 [Tepidisphaeraceae bacterium]
MGIRQAVNEHPGVSTGVTIAVIVLTLGVILWELFSSPHAGTGRVGKAFYSDDDGQTWFADEANKLTPFTDVSGRQAVSAYVFQCGKGKPFVGYLLRATEQERQAAAKAGRSADGVPLNLMLSEVKKPGARDWVRLDQRNPRPFMAITIPTCPDGGKPVPLVP